jgi:hypothetical protein
MSESSARQDRTLIIASWVLIGAVCLLSLLPFLGFASWLIVSPILFITLILGIIVVAHGETLQGVAILLVTLIVAPVFVLVAPFVTSVLGLGAAAAVSAPAVTSRSSVPSAPQTPSRRPESSKPAGKVPARLAEDADYRKFSDLIEAQAAEVAVLKAKNGATEGPRGFVSGSEALDLSQRELVQKENYYREEVFRTIALHTGTTPEQVAATFTAMARQAQPGANRP